MNTHTEVKMTAEKFEAYELVRRSGVTNMWDTAFVASLSAGVLTEEDVLDIIKNYDGYSQTYEERLRDLGD